MPVRKDIIKDEIQQATRTVVSRGRKGFTRAEQREIAAILEAAGSAATFEGAIADAEKYWRQVPADPKAALWTKPWYRAQILREISWVRKIVALRTLPTINHANLEAWIISAMNLGALITEAEWKFGVRASVRAKARTASEAAKRSRTAKAKDAYEHDIRPVVIEYRRRNPNHSVRTIAKNLAPDLLVSESTIRRHLADDKKMARNRR